MAEEFMVKLPLSNRRIEVGHKILEALDERDLSITLAIWFYQPETSKWRLAFASPDVRLKGPKHFYKIIQSVLLKFGDRPISLGDVYVFDETEPFVVSIKTDVRNLRGIPDSRLDQFIEDFYFYRPKP